MSPDLHARLMAHGIVVVPDVRTSAAEEHARLRSLLARRYPTGLGSYVFWRRSEPSRLHFSDVHVAAVVRAVG